MGKKLPIKEQVLLAYYVQYYLENKPDVMYELHERMSENMEPAVYEIAMNDLFDQGLINGLEKIRHYDETDGQIIKPMITNEGILYINNVLNIQSYASDGNKLEYVKNSLTTSGLELSIPIIAEYINEAAAKK
ncbi:hypothetical protein NLX67_07675 [Domibacillus sp. A3M-37]|uniref:hypothetical protein n=1 Tax=Domibacillus TaxID=1433999 RepID=UPI00061809D7|nr:MULTISPECIES: hypothetical protein [Domibacillus]MCP3762266.1 hypothetical protein [Domibacillus sp. A3M-37]